MIQLKKNIEEMRPSKKPFPERNWHYITNIGHNVKLTPPQARFSLEPKNRLSPFNQLRESLTHKELGALRRQLELKDVQLNELKQKLASHSRGALTPGPSSGLPARKEDFRTSNRSAEKLFQVPSSSVEYAMSPPNRPNRLYLTKKAPKPLSVDTITGLPRSTGLSPIQKAGAAVTKGFQRSYFN